jgi:hypothetical protein
MLRKAAVPVVGLLVMVLSGCASLESSRTAAATPPADVNGTWKGGYVGGTAEYTVVLKQTGSKVTGTLTGAGNDDGPIDGVVDGNSIRLMETTGSYGSTPALIVKNNQIAGYVRGTTLMLRRVQ